MTRARHFSFLLPARLAAAAARELDELGAPVEADEARRLAKKLIARARGVAYVDAIGRLVRP
ncbi:MAG TPA: hypothetical protein DCQ64_14100 [Candidatus Rokubacteria bacterium]|nr:hypothetical protein [Candidatus Rokubacteria bacterium]